MLISHQPFRYYVEKREGVIFFVPAPTGPGLTYECLTPERLDRLPESDQIEFFKHMRDVMEESTKGDDRSLLPCIPHTFTRENLASRKLPEWMLANARGETRKGSFLVHAPDPFFYVFLTLAGDIERFHEMPLPFAHLSDEDLVDIAHSLYGIGPLPPQF